MNFKACPDAGLGDQNPMEEQGGKGMERITDEQLQELEGSVDCIDDYTGDLAECVDDLCRLVKDASDYAIAHGGDVSAASKINLRLADIKKKAADAVVEIGLYLDDIRDVTDELGEQQEEYHACRGSEAESLVQDAADILRELGLEVDVTRAVDDEDEILAEDPCHDPGLDFLWDVKVPRECPLGKEGEADPGFSAAVSEFLAATVSDLTQATIALAMACAKANREVEDLRKVIDGDDWTE